MPEALPGEPWADAPMVYITIATCPVCGHQDYTRIRTKSEGDGSYSQKRVCDRCSGKYIAVFELPDSGRDDIGCR